MRWVQGRTVIEQMLAAGDLQRVPASREHADRLLEQARRHVSSTQNAAVADPEGAYALLYDAARKALTAILENQGLRPTSRGGHLAVYHAVRAQLDPPMGRVLLPFDRMRRRRHDVEYPPAGAPGPTPEALPDDRPNGTTVPDLARRALARRDPFSLRVARGPRGRRAVGGGRLRATW